MCFAQVDAQAVAVVGYSRPCGSVWALTLSRDWDAVVTARQLRLPVSAGESVGACLLVVMDLCSHSERVQIPVQVWSLSQLPA